MSFRAYLIDQQDGKVAGRFVDFSEDGLDAGEVNIRVAHHGGYAEIARLPADWVVKLPPGMSLLGIDSVNCPMPMRAEVWRRLAGDMRPAHLEQVTRTIALAQLPGVFDDFIQGRAKGRIVVAVGA